MNKTLYAIVLIGTSILVHAQSPAQKEVAAKDKVVTAEENLKVAKQQLLDTYPAFKKDAEKQIKDNDETIEYLHAHMIKPRRSPANDDAKKKIDDLENRNDDLRNRLYIQ